METYWRMDVYLHIFLTCVLGHAIVQEVSRRLPARVRSQVRSCGICDGQSGIETGSLRVLRFPLPILIPLNAAYSSIIRGWHNRPISGRRTEWTSLTPPQEIKKLTSALDGGEWPASLSGRFTPRERAPSVHWIGGRVGLEGDLDVVDKRKISCTCCESNPGRPARIENMSCPWNRSLGKSRNGTSEQMEGQK
jgi:hypothetical protein